MVCYFRFRCVPESRVEEEEEQVTTVETPVEYNNEVVDPKEAAVAAQNERGVFVPWPKKVTIPLSVVSQPFSGGNILFCRLNFKDSF